MKNKLQSISIVAMAIILMAISSCSNISNEPNLSPNINEEGINLNMSFDFEVDKEEFLGGETRALPFMPADNQNGFDHPSISLIMDPIIKKDKEKKMSMNLYFYNENIPKNDSNLKYVGEAISIEDWNYTKSPNGKIKITIKDFNGKLKEISLEQLQVEGWKMRAALGGILAKNSKALNKRNIIKFGEKTNLDNIVKGKVSELDIVYMSNPIDVEYKEEGGSHRLYRSDKKNPTDTNPILNLKSQSMVLFYSIKENQLNKEATLGQVKLVADNLSFKGHFSLETGEYTSEDNMEDGKYMKIFKMKSKAFELANPMKSRTPYVAIVAVPTKGASTTNLSLTPMITENKKATPTRTIEFQNKPIAPNTYYSLGDNIIVEN